MIAVNRPRPIAVNITTIAQVAKKFSPNLTTGHMANPQKRCRTCRRAALNVKKFFKRFKKGPKNGRT
jgi:hypothetical protein